MLNQKEEEDLLMLKKCMVTELGAYEEHFKGFPYPVFYKILKDFFLKKYNPILYYVGNFLDKYAPTPKGKLKSLKQCKVEPEDEIVSYNENLSDTVSFVSFEKGTAKIDAIAYIDAPYGSRLFKPIEG